MEGLKKYSMELISMDLAHEREIKDIQKRIQYLENKLLSSDTKLAETIPQKDSAIQDVCTHSNLDMSQPLLNSVPSCSQCGRELDSAKQSRKLSASSSYDLKFSKINMAMKKLKDDIKYAEVKRMKSS